MKILITGGLGYIGTELCEIYSGESRFKEITVIDKRFISERVTQLRNWGIKFIQGDILDTDLITDLVKKSDVVIHLAGITDVAYVKSDNSQNEEEIKTVGEIGTRNIIDALTPDAKLIFPSTHVVFEGFKEVKENLTEDVEPNPVLTYSVNKRNSEIDIINSKKQFIILRLGSVYGYSTDTMRIGIMPNLFSKIASQNGTIKLFGGGVQLKSLVNIKDVARCFKFFEENHFTNEIYHLRRENTNVKEVAELCKQINPKVSLIKTDDEIPNMGYTISNEKLLATGFEFRYSLEESLNEMISNWSLTHKNKNLEFILKGGNDYIDDRGRITNYELTEPINLIGYIESKKGTVRANHYHPIQEQKCLLIKGKYVSVIKDLADENSIIETRIINEGDIAVIHPNVIHTMVFLEDSVFLNLVRGEREHENYGLTHTIRNILVDEEFRLQIMNSYKAECRVCKSKDLEPVISFGKVPLANNLIDDLNQKVETFPLELFKCNSCNNCQLSYNVDPRLMFDHYLYTSSTSKSFVEHFDNAAEKYIKEYNLNKDDLIIDIGSNDGIGLRKFKELEFDVLGIEPAKNISEIANKNGITTINSYFNTDAIKIINKQYRKPRIILASNVFAHSNDLLEIATSAMNLLDDDGVFVIEVQYLVDTIKDLTFDNIYHEHYNYWSVIALQNLFNQIDYNISNVEKIDTHGGSIRIYIEKNQMEINPSVNDYIKEETVFGIDKPDVFIKFKSQIEESKINVLKNIKIIKTASEKIAAYAAPAKASTKLNYYGISSDIIEFIVEDNPLKHNKIIPGVNIPIYDVDYLIEKNIKVVIVLAWNFFDYIVDKNKSLIDKGVRFISIKDLEDPNFNF